MSCVVLRQQQIYSGFPELSATDDVLHTALRGIEVKTPELPHSQSQSYV